MVFCSETASKRPDYCYAETFGGSGMFAGWPREARPSINLDHIDGPLLYLRNGELHWLTLSERFLLWIGKTDALALERKYRPEIQLL